MQPTMSGDREEGVFDAKSRANRRNALVRPMSSRAA